MMTAGLLNLTNLKAGDANSDRGGEQNQADISINIKGIVATDGKVEFSQLFALEAVQAIDFTIKPPISGKHRDVMPPVILPVDAATIGKDMPVEVLNSLVDEQLTSEGVIFSRQYSPAHSGQLVANDLALFSGTLSSGTLSKESHQNQSEIPQPLSLSAKSQNIQQATAQVDKSIDPALKVNGEPQVSQNPITKIATDLDATFDKDGAKSNLPGIENVKWGELEKGLNKPIANDVMQDKKDKFVAQEMKTAKGEIAAGKNGSSFEQLKSALSGSSENKMSLNESIGQLAQDSASKKMTPLQQTIQPVLQKHPAALVEHSPTQTSLSPTLQGKAGAEQSAVQQLIASSEFTQGLNLKRQFTPNLAMRIQWMFNQTLSSAEILMDPPEMGPLSVKLQHNNGETSILFQVANLATKEALDDNLSRLKEMLAEQGILLGEAQVQHQEKKDQSGEKGPNADSSGSLADSTESTNDEQPVTQIMSERILDVYS